MSNYVIVANLATEGLATLLLLFVVFLLSLRVPWFR